MTSIHTIGIIGGGAWGTALAQILRGAGREVIMCVRERTIAEAINFHHHNPDYLPGVKLDLQIKATLSTSDLAICDAIYVVVPAQYMRETCKHIKGSISSHIPLILCSKGIETKTGALMSEVVAAELPDYKIAVLSGPTFAGEAAKGLPTAVTIAAHDLSLAQELAEASANKTFRPYSSNDVMGVQIGGAVKNVVAIGCGIVMGRGLGENARAALITRGLAEMTKLALACGAKAETLSGLSGLGDLVLTCGSPQSRNMSLGAALGKGEALQKVLSSRKSVSEGVETARALVELAVVKKVDMPICKAVHDILHQGADVEHTIADLLARPLRQE